MATGQLTSRLGSDVNAMLAPLRSALGQLLVSAVLLVGAPPPMPDAPPPSRARVRSLARDARALRTR